MASTPRYPASTSEAIRRSMLGNKRCDTTIELAVRNHLHAAGLRFGVDYAPDPADRRRRADIVFTRARVVVFIDGCYWHGCAVHYVEPKTNVDYWRPKIARNVARDVETTPRLTQLGWRVLRFWGHEPSAHIAEIVANAVLGTHPGNADQL